MHLPGKADRLNAPTKCRVECEDGPARLDLLSDTMRAVNASLGRGAELPLTTGTMQALKPAF